MNYHTALEILNLGNNFYEDQLMQAYHIQITRNDPSVFSMASPEVRERINAAAAEIEEAKDFLLDYMAPKSYEEVKPYINELFDKLYSLADSNDDLPLEAVNTKNTIISIAISFKSSLATSTDISMRLIDRLYDDSLAKIRLLYDDIKRSAYQKHHVQESDVIEKLDYEVNISEFLKQIDVFCGKYNRDTVLENKVEQVLSGFKNENALKDVQFLIDQVVEEIRMRIKNRNYQDYDDILAILKQKITDIIASYNDFKNRIASIKIFFEQEAIRRELQLEYITKDETDYQAYLKTLNSANVTFMQKASKIIAVEEILKSSFDTARMNVLIQKIEEYVAAEGIKAEVSKSNHVINAVFQHIIKKVHHVLNMCDVANDMKQIDYAVSLQSRVMRLFPKVYAGEISVESIRGLMGLTFVDSDYDDEIIKRVENQSLLENNIYLNNTHGDTVDMYALEIISGNHYLRKLDENYNADILEQTDEETLNRDYISLATFLRNAEFRGYNVTYYYEDVLVLYSYKDLFMFIKDGKIAFDKKSKFQPSKNKGYADIGNHADKSYTKDVLINQIKVLLNDNHGRK